MSINRYLITVWGDVEPDIHGPYPDDEQRLVAARAWRAENGPDHGMFKLHIDEKGIPSVDSFVGTDGLEEEELEADVVEEASVGTGPLQAGDRVKYSVKWLRSTGTYTGPLSTARGEIVELIPLGDLQLACIRWDNDPHGTLPERVNVANLVRESDPEYGAC